MMMTARKTICKAGTKLVWVRVGYGKNHAYVTATWVVEDALENFKTDWINIIRNEYGWKKEIEFMVGKSTVVGDYEYVTAYANA